MTYYYWCVLLHVCAGLSKLYLKSNTLHLSCTGTGRQPLFSCFVLALLLLHLREALCGSARPAGGTTCWVTLGDYMRRRCSGFWVVWWDSCQSRAPPDAFHWWTTLQESAQEFSIASLCDPLRCLVEPTVLPYISVRVQTSSLSVLARTSLSLPGWPELTLKT